MPLAQYLTLCSFMNKLNQQPLSSLPFLPSFLSSQSPNSKSMARKTVILWGHSHTSVNSALKISSETLVLSIAPSSSPTSQWQRAHPQVLAPSFRACQGRQLLGTKWVSTTPLDPVLLTTTCKLLCAIRKYHFPFSKSPLRAQSTPHHHRESQLHEAHIQTPLWLLPC